MARPAGRASVLLAVTAAALVLLPATATATATATAPAGVVTGGVDTLHIVAALNRHGGPAGTAWGIDAAADRVVVQVTADAAGGPVRALLRYAASFGDAVRVEWLPAGPAAEPVTVTSTVTNTTLLAGDRIYGISFSSVACSAGFAVITGSPLPPPPYAANRVLTSGRCTSTYPDWYVGSAKGPYLGGTYGSNYPGTDYGVIAKADGINAVSAVNLYNGTSRPIYSSGDPYQNRPVCMSGAGSGVRCGRIIATNQTVNYGSGTVYGLAAANFCSTGTDRGGPIFDGNTAIGLVSGSLSSCAYFPRTYIQPVGPAMQAYNLFFPPA